MDKKLTEYCQFENYNSIIKELADNIICEKWGENNYILKNYLAHTFNRLVEENKLLETDSYLVFNTGLFTKFYDAVYFYAKRNDENELLFHSFKTEYELGNDGIANLPQRADYFQDPSLLIFDWRLPVNIQYEHILDDEDNCKRLPSGFKDDEMYISKILGAVDVSIKKVIANYRLAVPQYYKGSIQLLLPLYLTNQKSPDLALVISKKNGYYQGHTCLTLEMAYNNARLIAKPEANWLRI